MKRLIYRYYDYDGGINGAYTPSISIIQISDSSVVETGTMTYDVTLKAYIYDFEDYVESIEYLADLDFGVTAIVRYSSMSFGGVGAIDSGTLVDDIATRITNDHGVGEYVGGVGGGGWGFSSDTIQRAITNAKKEIIEKTDEIKEEIVRNKPKDIDFTEIINKIEETQESIEENTPKEDKNTPKILKNTERTLKYLKEQEEKAKKREEKRKKEKKEEKDIMKEILKINEEVLEEIQEEDEMEEIIDILSEEILQEINN